MSPVSLNVCAHRPLICRYGENLQDVFIGVFGVFPSMKEERNESNQTHAELESSPSWFGVIRWRNTTRSCAAGRTDVMVRHRFGTLCCAAQIRFELARLRPRCLTSGGGCSRVLAARSASALTLQTTWHNTRRVQQCWILWARPCWWIVNYSVSLLVFLYLIMFVSLDIKVSDIRRD